MSLSLPADLEPYTNGLEDAHEPGVYALYLNRPSALADAWDEEYDVRPPYWQDLIEASRVVYVGGASDLLARLEDHRDGDVRQTALTKICDITGLHTVWVCEDKETAFNIEEPRLARMLQEEYPEWYIHQR